MTNFKDNAGAPPRTTVRIPTASGDELEAWLYLPKGHGPHPAVVMAHGIGGIRREDWLHSGGFWGRSGHEADVEQSLLLTLVV